MKKQTLVILGFIILFCSCATNQKIIYNLDDVLNPEFKYQVQLHNG